MRARVILFLFATVCACSKREILCGSWELAKKNTFVDSGSPQLSLIHSVGNRHVQIDDFVFTPRCFPNDCVTYGRSFGGEVAMYAVCGDRIPMRLMISRDALDNWSQTTDGLQRVAAITSRGDHVLRTQSVYRIADIRRRSLSQPKQASDWRQRGILEIYPVTEEVQIDRRSVDGTMLLAAIDSREISTAIALIRMGAPLNVKDIYGRDPLTLAAERDEPTVVVALIDAGVSTVAVDVRGDDVLAIVVNHYNKEAIRALAARCHLRVDVNKALRIATSLNQQDTVVILSAWIRRREREEC